MVKTLIALLLLVGCASTREAKTSNLDAMTAPRKALILDPSGFLSCDELPRLEVQSLPSWQSLVLKSDVEVWSTGACESLERALAPLEKTAPSRLALRAECDEKSAVLPSGVRAACRSVCAAQRWLAGRALGRTQVLAALEWFRDDFDSIFDRVEKCEGTKSHGNQLADGQVRALFACAGRGPFPAETRFLFQYVTEPVHWRENGVEVSSARPIAVEWLSASDDDENLPWTVSVARCTKGLRLVPVLTRF